MSPIMSELRTQEAETGFMQFRGHKVASSEAAEGRFSPCGS